jgi:hypothetical protein
MATMIQNYVVIVKNQDVWNFIAIVLETINFVKDVIVLNV